MSEVNFIIYLLWVGIKLNHLHNFVLILLIKIKPGDIELHILTLANGGGGEHAPLPPTAPKQALNNVTFSTAT